MRGRGYPPHAQNGWIMDIFAYTIYAHFRNIATRCWEIFQEKGINEAKEASEIANFLASKIRETGDVNIIETFQEKAEKLIELLKVLPKPIL
jgi:hypothetical protein